MSDTALTTDNGCTALLDVVSLSKLYDGHLALDDVSFAVQSGEVLGIIGNNGAGKTTLLEAIAGLLPIDAGQVLYRGQPLPLRRRRDAIFYLPDGLRPYADHYVQQILAFFAETYRRSPVQVANVVATLGLGPVCVKRVHALSKGYNRRLILALGFLTPHPVLLMDEPFDGFDLRQTRDMMEVLRRVAATGRTLVLSIHQLLDASRVCDRFVLLSEGRVNAVGTTADLLAQAGLTAGDMEDIFLALT